MDVPSGNDEMVRRLALLFANHADGFRSGSEPPSDAGYTWGEYSAREKYLATGFAQAALAALSPSLKEQERT